MMIIKREKNLTRGNNPDFKGFDVVVVVVVVVGVMMVVLMIALVLSIFDKLSDDDDDTQAESIILSFDVDVTVVVGFLVLEFIPPSAESVAFICSSIRFLNISRKLPSFANWFFTRSGGS